MCHHAPKNQPYVEQLWIDYLRGERRTEEIAQAVPRGDRFVLRLPADGVQQGQSQGFIRFRDETRLAWKMVVDQADRDTGRGADTAHRHAFMAKLLEAAQSRVHQCFSTHRGRRAVELRYMPLGCHLLPSFFYYTEARTNGAAYASRIDRR